MINWLIQCLGILFLGLLPALHATNVSIIGIGRLGLSYALLLEHSGYHVLGVDLDSTYVEALNQRTWISQEPGIDEMLKNSRNFTATTSLKQALDFADVYLIVVSTTIGTEGYNFEALTGVLTEINHSKVSNKQIVIHSTLFPGYIQKIARPLLADCESVTLSYNPPFIAQGEILKGLTCPDMILIGQDSQNAGDLIECLHRSFCVARPHIARMSVESAEIAKLALNCFVTSKIAFANLVGDIADETLGADKYDILQAIGFDSRVGSKYLMPGYGFGGPCFIRDNRALADFAELIGIQPLIFRATDAANEQHANYMARRLIDQELEEYVFDDVSYKPNCPVKIIYASQKLAVAKKIAESGKKVIIVDEQSVIDQVKASYGSLFDYRIINVGY